MHTFLISSEHKENVSRGFLRKTKNREQEKTEIKTNKVRYHVAISLNHEEATNGLGTIITLQRKSNKNVSNQKVGTDAGIDAIARRIALNDIGWSVPLFTANVFEQNLLLEHFATRGATDLYSFQKKDYTNVVTAGNNWNFELTVHRVIDFPIFVEVLRMKFGQFDIQTQRKGSSIESTSSIAPFFSVRKNFQMLEEKQFWQC